MSNFQDNSDFYNNCANTVIDFCRKYKIEHHIKYGTKRKDDRSTEKIFRKFPIKTERNPIQTPQLSI
ncbi:hypothetical protein KKB43_03580 [Patescibacteria group bacterium]|nr:hypothetical protein [Patescibacteria group bacterium]MBU4338213.1 hypothetical protein [Patescibacteria group bacterium]MBU4580072.1 hypothetical protein [Patescibacteria group bacterium]